MSAPQPNRGVWPWVVRGLLALAALAAPILVYKGFTDGGTPDPVKQQRLQEARPSLPPTERTTDLSREARP